LFFTSPYYRFFRSKVQQNIKKSDGSWITVVPPSTFLQNPFFLLCSIREEEKEKKEKKREIF
jgi:hypothetical protein